MAFTGNDPKDTYLGILTLGDDGGIPPVANSLHPTTLQPVLDAAGAASLLALSQDKVGFTGIMEASVSGLVMDSGVPLESDDLVTNQVLDKTDNNVGIIFTTGNPEGSLVAGIGSLALRKDGSSGTSLYIKESGVGDTGWTAVDIIPTFLDLTDTPNLYVAEKWVRVNEDGDALEFVDPPTVALGNFNELNDCPPSYEGFKGYVVAVNLAESGLTFTNAAVGVLTDLSDTPAALVESGILACNSDATAVEFIGTSATLGDILFFDGTVWTTLGAGTSGQVLTTQGAVADPIWADAAATFAALTDGPGAMTGSEGALIVVNSTADALVYLAGGPQGSIPFITSGDEWVYLTPGTAGQVLTTNGAGADPTWGDVTVTNINITDLDDTPADYGVDGQVLVTDGVDTLSWGDVPEPSGVPNYELVDEQLDIMCYGQINTNVTLTKETFTDYLIDDTPDGATLEFGSDVAGSPLYINIEVGSLAITATVSGAPVVITDPAGDGNLVGSNVTGTINYASGEWHLTFTGTAPTDTTDITADFDAYTSTAPGSRLTAYDCIRAIHGGVGPFEYGIERDAPTYGYTPEANARDAYVEADCTDALGGGIIQVFVYVHDAYNNIYGPVLITWNVQDNLSACAI